MGFSGMRRALVCLALLPCLGFEWPGRVYRVTHAFRHADAAERRELVRSLRGYSAESAKEPLLIALEDSDAGVRLEAADIAGRVGLRDAVPILLDWIDDKEAETRRAAVAALGQIGEPRALAALVRALGDSSNDVRRAAVIALKRFPGPEAVEALLGRLDDPDLGVRIEAITSLAELRDTRAVVPLLGAAVDPAAEVRDAAIGALGALRDTRAEPALARALGDEVEEVRLAAAAAIGRLRGPLAARALKPALEHADARLGQAIAAALGNLDDDAARDALIAELEAPALQAAAARSLVFQARRQERLAALGMRADSPGDAARAPTVLALATALRAGSAGGSGRVAIARLLGQLAGFTSIEVAIPALIAVLDGPDAELTRASLAAIGQSGAPSGLMPLLERLGQSAGPELDALLDALRAYFEHAEPDGRAADPLLGRLSQATGPVRLHIVELLGKVKAPRALPALVPLLAATDTGLRLTAIDALAEIGAAEATPALLPRLDADDARERLAAARALRATADAGAVGQLLDRLDSPRTADQQALLTALGGALGRLAHKAELPEALAKRAKQSLLRIAAGDDDELSDAAVEALSVWAPSGSVNDIANGLRMPSSRRRAAAAHALGQLGDPEARQVLRYVLQHGSGRDAAAAAAALGEVGDQRDVAALAKASVRQHWPVPGAAVYALARIAQRGAMKPHMAARQLCALGRSREPFVLANVAAGLAALAAPACDDGGPDPLRWLEPTHAALLRAAAARWLFAAARAGKIDPARAEEALARCAEVDDESMVRATCASPAIANAREPADVVAYAGDGTTLLRDSLVGLRFADGAVFVGFTDHNARLRMRAAPRGELALLDPTLTPLEAPNPAPLAREAVNAKDDEPQP